MCSAFHALFFQIHKVHPFTSKVIAVSDDAIPSGFVNGKYEEVEASFCFSTSNYSNHNLHLLSEKFIFPGDAISGKGEHVKVEAPDSPLIRNYLNYD